MQINILTDCTHIKHHALAMAKSDKDEAFSARFRQMVVQKGCGDLKLAPLAKKLGVSTTCAHFYMNGERLPAIDSARKIADLFDVCVEWLLTGKGPMRPNTSESIDLSSLTQAQRKALLMLIESFKDTQQLQSKITKKIVIDMADLQH